jgi:hypothetical protein
MGFDDILKGYTPQENDDDKGFDILKGKYKTKLNFLKKDYPKDDVNQLKPKYRMELEVVEDIEGDKGMKRKFWKSYDLHDDEKMKKLLNDLHTAGLDLPKGSKEDFESAFPIIKDALVFVRAYGFTPATRKDGSPNDSEPKERIQVSVIYNPAKVKAKPAAADKVPF